MKLSEILEQVDTMVPNSLTASTKISWINHVQNQLFRDYPLPEKVHFFTVVVGRSLYPLPDDCPEDRIRELVVDKINYPFMVIGPEESLDRFCTIADGNLLIYPIPEHQSTGVLFYKARPIQLTEADMEVVTNFPIDFQELLVLGCAYRVAKATPEHSNLVSVLDQDYRLLAEKADLVLRQKMPRQVTLHRSWM